MNIDNPVKMLDSMVEYVAHREFSFEYRGRTSTRKVTDLPVAKSKVLSNPSCDEMLRQLGIRA
jgi:hypothetical protein